MSTREAVVAVRRFGLGARPGELDRLGGDARGFLLASLARKDAALIRDPGLEPSHVVFANAQQARVATQTLKAFGEAGGTAAKAKTSAPDAPSPAGNAMTDAEAVAHGKGQAQTKRQPEAMTVAPETPAQIRRTAFQREMAARMEQARTTEGAFVERLVMFWSNHFCVNASKGAVLGLAGAFEREAIRPHVLGRFTDMLLAVEQHPAMLIYLDNQVSTGPNSPVGRSRNRGLNENLAREILELHTLGVDGGYTQADVTNLAHVITGWTIGQANQPNAEHGRFFFAAFRHEPGTHRVLGQSYGNAGVTAGQQCLADLARHPATGRHLARKLAIHFVSETPPPALLTRLETAFRDSDGDLAAVARALVTADEAWSAPPRKVLPPYDFMVALLRAFDLEQVPVLERARLMATLGQPLWQPPSPKGWPDSDETWAGPSTLRERLRIAERVAALLAQRGHDPRSLAEALLGAALSEATRQAIARAEAREQAFALLIMSPEFQRR